jgi:excinuclease ABC subunit C
LLKNWRRFYYPDDSLPLLIDKRSPGLKVIQQMRNEAHRFAISFHRDLRSKSALRGSELDDMPGIGPKTRDKLLKQFRSLERLRQASPEQVEALVGPAKARLVLDYLEATGRDPEQPEP